MTIQVTPAMLAGINRPGEGRQVSPEAQDLVSRIRDHYRSLNKASAAHNYSRHLKSFFAWAEGAGYSIRNLPVDAVESFLASLAAAGQKETTLYVMRTQLKAALREIHNVLGVDMSHLEYQTGKPPEVRKAQKQKEKQQRAEKRLVQTAAQLQAIQAAQASLFAGRPGFTLPAQTEPTGNLGGFPDDSNTLPTPEYPMSDQSAPQTAGQSAGGSAPAATQQSQNPVVVVQMPPQNTRPTASVVSNGATQATGARTVQPTRGLQINTLMFTGPYIKISYIADGSNPLSPPGTEIALQLLPTSQVAPHGDLATYLQQFIIPKMRLGSLTSQVQFVFHELNEKRQPTGRKDEMVVSVPLSGDVSGAAPVQTQQIQPVGGQPATLPFGAPAGGMDEATRFLLTKLDREAEEAKRHAQEVQEQMRKASDTTSMMMLMQQFQRAEDARREAENRRDAEAMRAMQQAQQAQFAALAPPTPMPMPTVLPPEPQQNVAAEFAKALAESQRSMMELVIAFMNRPQPTPPPPPVQKDAAEWLVPFMAQMNQQAIQQQQAQQQMLVGIMQGNQQFMQALITRESPELKFMMQQLQEVKAAANSPKADEVESFADKLQKYRMVGEMLGGGGSNVLSELLANADTIGAGAAKVIAAAKSGKEPQIPQLPMNGARQNAPQLPAAIQQQQAAQQEAPIPAPPQEALAHLQSVVEGLNQGDDQAVVNNVLELVKALLNAPEPYPVIGRRMLVTLKTAEDEADLTILAKNLWSQLGQPVDRPAAKMVAKILTRWYSVIHQQVFGEPRNLEDAVDGDEEGEQSEQEEQVEQAEQGEPDEQEEQATGTEA